MLKSELEQELARIKEGIKEIAIRALEEQCGDAIDYVDEVFELLGECSPVGDMCCYPDSGFYAVDKTSPIRGYISMKLLHENGKEYEFEPESNTKFDLEQA